MSFCPTALTALWSRVTSLSNLHQYTQTHHTRYNIELQNIQFNRIVIIRINGIFYIITSGYMLRLYLFEPSSG